ncbi:MAG TPA: hypothetical protein PK668_22140 [Myxococcota bacterium]|nr:hypothetical protein [Myxococcota bacterium]HRY96323.1 hypothetical protein [Myxococcota bacterium]HSA22480.1 hypothetical protein [Myxococcota bacterium]
MRTRAILGWGPAGLLLVLALIACDGGGGGGLYQYDWQALIPGPGETGHDAELEAVARQRDRQFHVFHTLPTGLSTEVAVAREKTAARAAIERFLREEDGWDFEASSGMRVEEAIDSWSKVAGAYAGVGVAADAFRYGTLRDQRYPAEEVERARDQLVLSIQGLHRAVTLTGAHGVIARGYANRDFAGAGQDVVTTPLFDGLGNPLPAEKTNGTWREDNSGLLPDYVWEDSCSRDMLIGWATGVGAVWEVAWQDDTIPAELKAALREDARAMLAEYRVVRATGYDLEIPDADGRTTYHGYLNENNIDRAYIDGAQDGFYAIMTLGIVPALAAVAEDPEADAWLGTLLGARDLPHLARDHMMMISMDELSNFSNYNMSFSGAWLALRHLTQDQARADVRAALASRLFDEPGRRFKPVEFSQSFFDFTAVLGACDASARWGCRSEPDPALLARGLETLREFPAPPFWEFSVENCDAAEVASRDCTALDGSHLTVLGEVGRNGDLITAEPLPMAIRSASNYYWRSNPYVPNGGADGPGMYPGPDFRFAYWLGRWARR